MLRIPTVEGASEQETCGFIPDLPPVDCVTLGKSFQLAGLQSAHLYTERSWNVSSNVLYLCLLRNQKYFVTWLSCFSYWKKEGRRKGSFPNFLLL